VCPYPAPDSALNTLESSRRIGFPVILPTPTLRHARLLAGTPTLPGVPIPDLLAKLPPSDHYRFDVLRAGLTNRAHRAAREAYTNAGIEPPVGAAGTADSRPSAHSNGNCRRRQHDSALLMLGPDTPRDVIFAQAAAVQQAHDTDGPSGTIVVSRRRVMVRKRIA
jgi:hypothetical protein